MALHKEQAEILIFSAAAANGNSTVVEVGSFKNVQVSVHTSGNTTATIKFYGSIQQNGIDFSAAASPTNRYYPVAIYQKNTATALDGTTGIVLSGTDINSGFLINSDGDRFICAKISGYSDGAITVSVKGLTNE